MEGARSSSCSKMPAGTWWSLAGDDVKVKVLQHRNTKRRCHLQSWWKRGIKLFSLLIVFFLWVDQKNETSWKIDRHSPTTSHIICHKCQMFWFFASWFASWSQNYSATNEPERSREWVSPGSEPLIGPPFLCRLGRVVPGGTRMS